MGDEFLAKLFQVFHKLKKLVKGLFVSKVLARTASYKRITWSSDMICLSIETPKSNKISICSKSKIDYFWALQHNYNVLKYWNT